MKAQIVYISIFLIFLSACTVIIDETPERRGFVNIIDGAPDNNVSAGNDFIDDEYRYYDYNLTGNGAPEIYNDEGTIIVLRIDDIYFGRDQKELMMQTRELAEKYDFVWTLGVIAKEYRDRKNAEVYDMYLDNKDVYVLAAHGYDHTNPLNSKSKGEFRDKYRNITVPRKVQEQHFQNMMDIFERYEMDSALKIILLPQSQGDENTVQIASEKGYKFMSIFPTLDNFFEQDYDGLMLSKVMIARSSSGEVSDEELASMEKDVRYLIKKKVRYIMIVLHPEDFEDFEGMEEIVITAIKIKNEFSDVSLGEILV